MANLRVTASDACFLVPLWLDAACLWQKRGPFCGYAKKLSARDRKQYRTAALKDVYNRGRGDPVPRQFDVVIERDREGYYVASVPQIPSCHTQGRSPDEVTDRIREAIELCLEVETAPEQELEFVGIQRVKIAA